MSSKKILMMQFKHCKLLFKGSKVFCNDRLLVAVIIDFFSKQSNFFFMFENCWSSKESNTKLRKKMYFLVCFFIFFWTISEVLWTKHAFKSCIFFFTFDIFLLFFSFFILYFVFIFFILHFLFYFTYHFLFFYFSISFFFFLHFKHFSFHFGPKKSYS